MGSVDSLRQVVRIAARAARQERVALVVSAAAGVTDTLIHATGPESEPTDAIIEAVRTRHVELAEALLGREGREDYFAILSRRLVALRVNLDTAGRAGTSPALYDAIISEGERLMAPLVALALTEAGISAEAVNAAQIVRTDEHHGDAQVDLAATRRLAFQWLESRENDAVPVFTGFIGATASGAITTLGRSGSDYSAAVIAAALGASRFERWTDTDGLYTDDPRSNPNAKRLACIVLETAVSWNQAGRLGMHRKALDPLLDAGIPVFVRCTYKPDEDGTVILPTSAHHLYRREAV